MQTIISKTQFAKLCAIPAALRFTTSAAAIVLSLGLGLSGTPAMAQDTSGEDAAENSDPDVSIEIAAIEGQQFNGTALGQFLPVVVGGFGDLLFLNRSEIGDVFLSFDGNLSAINAPSAFGSQNLSLPTYTIDSQGQGYALTTTQGIATGFVGEDDPSDIINVSDAFAPGQVSDTGNFSSGARPIFLNDQTAILLSDVGLANDGVATGETRTFVLFAEFLGEFDQPVEFVINDDTITSLNFAGPEALLASSSNLLSSANSAQTSNLLRVDISDGIDDLANQVGPNGNPQISLSGGFLGGDLMFDGFTFNGNTFEGGTIFGGGANFDAREFSANETSTAFVLNNALVGLDGSNDPSLPGQLLALDDKVILAISQTIRFGTPTSIGEVNFMGFNDVVLAANGDIFFTSSTTDLDGAPLANEVGLWRIINPGQADQAIVPVLTAGDELFLPAEDIERLFIETPPPGETSVRIADFNTAQQSFTAPNQTDGRPRFLSVNSDGHVATVVRIETNFGSLDAIVAQDDDGIFNIVAYVGQQITVNGPDDTRVITSFRAQFGSNDLDGAGDLYNSDEQLGFVVTLDDLATEMVESTSAVLRVSLNGQAPRPAFTEFLWNGGCGDDEFSTDCTINGQDGTNWVNAEDTSEVAEDPPGFNAVTDSATINGVDVRISVLDVNIARLSSDSKITIQNGRTLTLSAASNIDELVIENGTVASAETLTTRLASVTGEGTIGGLKTDFLDVDGTLAVSDAVEVSSQLTFTAGTINGDGEITLLAEEIDQRPMLNITGRGNRLATEITVVGGEVIFDDGGNLAIDTNGVLRLTGGSTTSLTDGSITGVGELALEDGSSFTANGTVLVAADVFVRDGADAAGAAQSAIVASANTTLRLDDLTFTREASGAIADDNFAQISIANAATIFINEDDALTIDDQVRLLGDGVLQVDGTFNLSDRGLFENTGTVQTQSSRFSGNGAFVNRGTLTLTPQEGQTNIATIDAQFANLDDGRIGIGDATFIDFTTSAAREAASTADLRALGLDELGVSLGALTDSLPDTGVLLEFGSNAEGAADALPFSFLISGDGSAFLIGSATVGSQQFVSIQTDAILSGDFDVRSRMTLGAFGQVQELTDIHVVDRGVGENALRISGTGIAEIANANIFGVTAPVADPDPDAVANRAVLENAVGERTFDAGTILISPNFAEALRFLSSDSDPFSRLSIFTNVTLQDIDLVNSGLLDLRSLTNATGTTTRITNSGWLRIGAGFKNEGTLELETQNIASRLEISGALEEDLTIASISNSAGRVQLDATGGTITVSDLTQTLANSNSSGPGSLLKLGSDTVAVVNKSNAVLAGGLDDEFAELQGRFDVAGDLKLLQDGEENAISVIALGGSAVIREGGSINSLDQNGSGLVQVNGEFRGAGRFTGDTLMIMGNNASAQFNMGIASQELSVSEGAEFTARAEGATANAVNLDQLNLGGTIKVRQGVSQITNIDSAAGSEAEFAGDLSFETITLAGKLQNSRIFDSLTSSAEFTLKGATLSVGDTGNARVDNLDIDTITIAQGGMIDAMAEVEFLNATVDGSFTIEEFSSTMGATRALNIGATGVVGIDQAASLTKLEIDAGGQLSFDDGLNVTGTGATTIEGRINGRGALTFDGALVVESTGRIAGNSFRTANLTAASILSNGRLTVGEVRTTEGGLTVNSLEPTEFTDTELDLTSVADLSATLIDLVGSSLVNTGAITVQGAAGANSFSIGSYQGAAGSYIQISGNSVLFGDLSLAAGSAFRQDGNLNAVGFLRQARTATMIVSGSSTIRSANPTTTAIVSSNVIEPNRSLQRVLSATSEVNDDSVLRHEIEGQVIILEDSEFDSEVLVSEDGQVQIGGNAVFDFADIDGSLFVGGDATLNSARVAGSALIEGDLMADSLTVDGSLQFASGVIGDLIVGVDGQLLADNFTLTSDFTNLGTFQLGDVEGGPGQFTTEGVFLQGGIFSGTGTINGSLIQAAQEGGRAGNELLFNPGFSPGILNITGDATFDEGVVLMEIGGLAPGTEHDQINVTGMLTFGSNAMLVVDLLETANGEIFLPETGDEIVLFTASDISPDDVEQINFSVIDVLPRGFTIVPDITTTADGEILRVLRGFNGSLLSELTGLDPAQVAVAGAIDFLSSSDSGVPSIELFQRAVDLQFADTMAEQTAGLTELSGTTLSGLQATALTAGRYNMEFIKDRLSASAISNAARQPARAAASGTPTRASVGNVASGNREFDNREFALAATRQINRSGVVSYGSADGPTFRFLGAATVNFGDQDSRVGTVGFKQDGWSASLGAELENGDGDLVIGAAATLGENDADLDGGLGDVSSESTGYGLYAAYDAGVVRVAVAYSMADLDLETNRRVQGRTAAGSSDGSVQSLHAHIFAPLVGTSRVTIGPKIAFEHHDLEIDESTETGAGDLSLLVSGLERKASAMNFSAVTDIGFDLGRWEGALEIETGYQLALSGDAFTTLPVAFAGAPGTQFSNPLRPLMNDGFALDIGLSLVSQRGLDLRVTYDGLFGKNGQEQHAVSAQAIIAF